jgi:hypothetical protein
MTAGQAGTPGNAPLMITSQSMPSTTSSGSGSGVRRPMGEKPHVYQTMRSRAMEMLEKAISETFEVCDSITITILPSLPAYLHHIQC